MARTPDWDNKQQALTIEDWERNQQRPVRRSRPAPRMRQPHLPTPAQAAHKRTNAERFNGFIPTKGEPIRSSRTPKLAS